MGVSLTLKEALMKKFEYMKENKHFFISAFSSSDYNNLLAYDYQCIYDFYKSVAETRGTLTPKILFLLQFYCHGSMDMTAEWVRSGMTLSAEEMAERLELAMPEALRSYLHTLSTSTEKQQ